jgi:hypothetical protein
MGRCLLIGAAVALVLSGPSFAQAASSDPQFTSPGDPQLDSAGNPQFNSALDPGAKMICKPVPISGSRFTERQCKTAANWDKIAEAARQGASDTFNKPGFYDCHSAGGFMGSLAGPAGGGAKGSGC